jgi:hypothetical protein
MGTDVRVKQPTRRKRRPDGTFEPLECSCEHCGRVYIYDHERGHSKRLCNSCHANGWISRTELKRRLAALKGGKCQICGYSRCLKALTFHHLDPDTKLFNLAGSHNQGWEAQAREVAKCVLLCANCHREFHAGVASIPMDVEAEVRRVLEDCERIPRRRPGRPLGSRNAPKAVDRG